MIDIMREIEAIQREVGHGRIAAGEGRTIRLRRTYEAPIDDVWDALTNPERMSLEFWEYMVRGSEDSRLRDVRFARKAPTGRARTPFDAPLAAAPASLAVAGDELECFQ